MPDPCAAKTKEISMKQFTLNLALLLFALSMSGAEKVQPDELTGVIHTKNVKALSPCILDIDGGHSIGLRGEELKSIPDGSQIWVKGRLHTFFYDNTNDPLPAMNPLQWHIYMDVTEWKVISAPFERPNR